MRTVRDEYFLSLGEIAQEYRRNGEDVQHALFNAFWRGCFEPYVRQGEVEEYPLMSRQTALKAWCSLTDHDGLVFASSPEEEIREPDGTIVIVPRTWIVVPPEETDWTPKLLNIAYGQLANVSVEDISSEAIAGLSCQFLGAYELLAVLSGQGRPAPLFWLHWDPDLRPSKLKKAEEFHRLSEAAIWFCQKLKNAAGPDVRLEDLFDEAVSHGLCPEQFHKLWDVMAPDHLKRGGRRLGTKNRHSPD